MAAEWLILLGALAAGFALGALTIFAASAFRRRPRPADEPEVVRLEPVEDDAPAPFEDHFGVSHAAPRAPAPAAPRPAPHAPEASLVPTEWAARATDAPLAPGHVRGVCSGCGTPLSVGPRRPLRIACPECGRTRLLA